MVIAGLAMIQSTCLSTEQPSSGLGGIDGLMPTSPPLQSMEIL